MQGQRQNSLAAQSKAERNPFRRAITLAESEEIDMDTLRKQERAIRAFTESIEMDFPPAPELPASLDIDHYGFAMKESSTSDTIIDVAKLAAAEQEQIDRTKGETQKYQMAVPAPEFVDQEIELHKSLLKNADLEAEEDLPSVLTDTNANYNKPKRPSTVAMSSTDSQALRRQYSSNPVQRPRPTTPTSWCAIDAYVQAEEERGEQRRHSRSKNDGPPDSGAKIRVQIPNKERAKSGQRERRNSMSWSDFHASMEQPSCKQSRSDSKQAALDFDAEWANATEPNPWEPSDELEAAQMSTTSKEQEEEAARRTSIQSNRRESQTDRRASQASKSSDIQKPASPPKAETPTENASNPIVPTRAAPPPPPKKKQVDETQPTVSGEYAAEEAPLQSEFGDPSQFYQGYGETEGAVGYDPASYNAYDYGTQNYDQSAYGYDQTQYDQTQYDPNAYANYGASGYEQYYQGYEDYNTTGQTYSYETSTTEQGYTYDPNTGQYNYDYSQQEAHYEYDPNAYNAGYDQYGLQTTGVGVVGADDSETSTSVTPRPDASPTIDEISTGETTEQAEAPSTANYDYSQYNQYDYSQQDYSQQDYSYPTADYSTNVTVNEPDAFDTSAYGTEPTQDYSAYGSQMETTDYSMPEPSTLPIVPLLPQQRARTPDPFSWEAQQKNIEETGSALPPPRPPPMAKTPDTDRSASPVEESDAAFETKAEPPSRPVPPSSKQPPSRPAAPNASPSRQMPPVPPPPAKKQETPQKEAEEEDPWARFNKMSEQVSSAVKSTEQQLKNLGETTAAKEIKDESYISQIGGTNIMEMTEAKKKIMQLEEEKKKAKADKKARKSASSKKNILTQFDPKKEEDMEAAAAALVAKMAASRAHDLGDWKPPTEIAEKIAEKESPETPESLSKEEEPVVEKPPEQRRESTKSQQSVKEEAPPVIEKQEEIVREGWAGFDTSFNVAASTMPTSESDFFATNAKTTDVSNAFGDESEENGQKATDAFAPVISAFDADPFDTRPIEEIVAEAKKKAELEGSLQADDNNLLHGSPATTRRSTSRGSTPTPEGGSPISSRPTGFEDNFKMDAETPLYDEDDSQPLEEFEPKFEGDGWDLLIRHPLKKKNILAERCWKPCFVRFRESDNMLRVFNAKDDDRPILEIMLQASYSLSENTLQAYDAYGKIHTVKLQHVLYKERVGIRAGQISRLVEGHITKYGLPLEHAAQINVLAKFASLNADVLHTFISTIEDVLFHCSTKRDSAPTYKQDEVQIHCYDEYKAHVDKLGNVSKQRARVRMFCLSFLTGSPFLEIGLNDRRREGKEIVRRKDILPMYTERWIRFEGLEFHNTVEQGVWDEDQVIRLQPPDSCFFEVMRFRVRPPRNREKVLTVKSIMKIAGSKVEIRIDVMAAAQQQLAKGTAESSRTIPCEDIQIRFPIPDAWIYIFREERTWGVGSVHSKTRRPGKVKNLKDRLMGAVQHTENTLIEVAIGEAKYEHVYRALVWRIPRLPEKHHQAYKSHLLKCRFQLSSFDLMPEEFLPNCEVEFTMPLATISNTVVRSVSVEQHEDSDRVEKFVRYVAKCHYDQDIDYVQVTNLNDDYETGIEFKKHQTAFNPDDTQAQYEGYKIEVDESKIRHDDEPVHQEQPMQSAWDNNGASGAGNFDFEAYARQGNGGAFGARRDSSSEEEDDKSKFPVIQIDMSSYGY